MEKNSLRTLKERYDSEYETKQNTHAKFLKRKRLESHRTLEEVSRGICSPSYLSKIENAQVEVDEYYFKALFERLDIGYEDFKAHRQDKIFNSFFQFYLNHQIKEIEQITNNAIKTKAYCDTEIELMVLFLNIITNKFEEAKILITNLEAIRNALSNEELLTFVFLTTLYCYKTQQTVKAQLQMAILLNIKLENEFVKIAVYDLAINIYNDLGKIEKVNRYYYTLKRSDKTEIVVKRLIYHSFKLLSSCGKDELLDTIDEFKRLFSTIENDPVLIDEYYFHLAKLYYRMAQYSEALETIRKGSINARNQALIAAIMLELHDYRKEAELLPLLSRYQFTKYENVYAYFVDYVRQKLEQYSYLRLLSYLKNIVFNNDNSQIIAFFHNISVEEYLKLGYECGKYKETLRFVMRILLSNQL